MSDSPNISDQTALTTSTGKIWLVTGAILTAVCIAVLIPRLWMTPSGVAAGGIIAVVALYTAMIPVRLGVHSLRVRLWTMATLMILIPIAFFVAAGIVYSTRLGVG
ncbi:MAG: hypothetical protein ABI275_08090 [Terrimesophilobacter sp.]